MQGIRKTIAFYLKLVFLILFLFIPALFPGIAFSQQNLYDTDLLPVSFHENRRDTVRSLLPPNSCAVFFSNPVRNRSNNQDFQFSQDPNFYYLTGLNEPNSALIIFSSPQKIAGRQCSEILFVQDRDKNDESWNGKRLGIEGASSRLGFKNVFLNTEFEQFLPDFSKFDAVLAKLPTDISETGKRATLNLMVATFREKAKKHKKEIESFPLTRIMTNLREIKTKEELKLMQMAVDMTVAGFEEVMRAIQPGMTEYQAQAIMEFYFRHHGSEIPGYNSISGGGENSCVLHYITNRKKLSPNDLLLMDMGASYHGYTADVTRTVPVDGKFSTEKTIYDIVLDAQLKGIAAATKGNQFQEPHRVASAIIATELVKLGIIKDASEIKKYFNHGTSHYLGLDVHDAGNFGELKPGMVITVEPGIYIPEGSPCDKKWWNIGVRIEDDVLITDNEPFVMSGFLVKSVAGIERMMQQESLFNKVK